MTNLNAWQVESETRDINEHLGKLVGSPITGLFVSDDQDSLMFRMPSEDGDLKVSTYADCCSETWFADITGVHNLLNQTVVAVEWLNTEGYNVEDGRTRQEYDSAYGFRIKTAKGDTDFVFRNSSNGYYGGSLTSYHSYGNGEKWSEITEDDWQA